MAKGIVMDKLYLENLEEEVLQLNNVITYKWLIRTIKTSANVAKQMLYEFVEKKNAAGVKLNVTYLVAGQKANENNIPVHQICIVPLSKLEATKAKFSTVTSVHIYGIHKAEVQDHDMLYAADYDAKNDSRTKITMGWAIRCQNVHLRGERLEIADISSSADTSTDVTASPQLGLSEERTTAVMKKEPSKLVSVTGSKKATCTKSYKDGGNLAGMFQNMEKRNQEQKNKQTEELSAKVIKDEGSNSCIKSTGKQGSTKSSLHMASGQNVKDKKSEESKQKEIFIREKRVKPENAAKKRRRIIQISDSSSEDDRNESEDLIVTPVESSEGEKLEEDKNPIPLNKTDNLENSKIRCRKRKLVEISGMDEDGFLVTQKKWEEASASEESANENEDPVQKEKKEKPVKPTKCPAKSVTKNKQVTLTSFFKKK